MTSLNEIVQWKLLQEPRDDWQADLLGLGFVLISNVSQPNLSLRWQGMSKVIPSQAQTRASIRMAACSHVSWGAVCSQRLGVRLVCPGIAAYHLPLATADGVSGCL